MLFKGSAPMLSMFLYLPQVALERQCPRPWLTSPALMCIVWPCRTFLAAANLMSYSRSTASTGTPSSRGSARCWAARPMPSNLTGAPPTSAPSWEDDQSCMVLSHWTPALSIPSLWMTLSMYWRDVILCCTPWCRRSPSPFFNAFITSHARTSTSSFTCILILLELKQLCYQWLFDHRKCCILSSTWFPVMTF